MRKSGLLGYRFVSKATDLDNSGFVDLHLITLLESQLDDALVYYTYKAHAQLYSHNNIMYDQKRQSEN